MATTLPPSTDYTGVVTQGGKKTFMTAFRSFVADLFGTDSTMATAHAAFRNYDVGTLRNLGLLASASGNQLTIALKDASGNDPSATSPVLVGMRSATLTSGGAALRNAAAAQSVTIPLGATMGQANGVAARLWVALIDNAGTLELAVMNTQLGGGQIQPVSESSLITTTALSAAADNAGVWYSTTARSNVPFRLVGYVENTQASAGTWATPPTVVQPMGPGVRKPGDVIQTAVTITGASSSSTALIPADDTIPQISEGTEFLTKSITPASAINSLEVEAQFYGYCNAAASSCLVVALFQDATASALEAAAMNIAANGFGGVLPLRHVMAAGTTSATTFRLRAGASTTATTTFNGQGGGRILGGVGNSFIKITEVMA